jgi:hypothetical protein
MKTFVSGLMITLVLTGCNKDNGTNVQQGAPEQLTISLSNPAENQEFQNGAPVSISGTITWNQAVHGYTLELINTSNQDSVLFLSEVHTHDNAVPFDGSWVNDLQDTSAVLLRVTAIGDHQGTITETTSRNIWCIGL